MSTALLKRLDALDHHACIAALIDHARTLDSAALDELALLTTWGPRSSSRPDWQARLAALRADEDLDVACAARRTWIVPA